MTKWITAYFAGWQHHSGRLPTSEINWNAMTHMCYFARNILYDSSTDSYYVSPPGPLENITEEKLADIVPAAHNNGVRIIMSFGGAGNTDFINAIMGTDTDREKIANEIVQFMVDYGFDGVDLDPEPVNSISDNSKLADFVVRVRSKLDTKTQGIDGTSRPLLLFATNGKYSVLSNIQDEFDQINLMTYDFSGAYPGWMSWYNSNVYSRDVDGSEQVFNSTGATMPSIDREVQSALSAGIRKEKLGIGTSWYAFHWSGGRQNDGPNSDTPINDGIWGPRQEWPESDPSYFPTVQHNREFYSHLYPLLSNAAYEQVWDDQAKAAYLSKNETGYENDEFVSYESPLSIFAKFNYLKSMDLGGMIIWEIGTEYLPGEPEEHPLVSEVESQILLLDRVQLPMSVYTSVRDDIGRGEIDLLNDTIKVALITSAYNPDINDDQFFSEISSSEASATGYPAGGFTLSGKSLDKNTGDRSYYFNANDINQEITGSLTFQHIVIYKDTGTESTSPLIAYINLGISQSINDNTLGIQWDSRGILRL